MLCRGGDGGHGNAHFKTSTNRAPRRADPGLAGRGALGLAAAQADRRCRAGRAAECRQDRTFLAAVSAARPKIADYPFTTLHPQLGVVRLSHAEEFVLADIPGLIEGAHEGAGLGDRFLGHVERCAVLLHLVDGAAGDVVRAWRTVREELEAYGGGLADKPELIALNKADAMTPREASARRAALARASGRPVMLISGVTGQGVPEVLRALMDRVREHGKGRCCRHDRPRLAGRQAAGRQDRQRAGRGRGARRAPTGSTASPPTSPACGRAGPR